MGWFNSFLYQESYPIYCSGLCRRTCYGKPYWDGTESCYSITFRSRDTGPEDSTAVGSLKRKSDSPAELLTKSKRHHASQRL